MAPKAKETDLENLVTGNNSFACDLYQALRQQTGNIFYSPYSISSALAMTYAGARKETEKQMATAMHIRLPQEKLHPAFSIMSSILGSRGKDTYEHAQQRFKLTIVNAIWSQKAFTFSPAFLDVLSRDYSTSVRLLDFIHSPEEARLSINAWVKEQTNSYITALLPEASVNSATLLVLTDVVFFTAAWCYQFNDTDTTTGQFHLLDGSIAEVPMMRLSEHIGYTKQDGYQAIELMYLGREISMVILLPDTRLYEATERALDYQEIRAIINNLKESRVVLTMPKFKFSSSSQLGTILARMGMPIVFSKEANFSGMAEKGGVFVNDVFHDTFVSVDEKGTEATAATSVPVGRGISGETKYFTIDRPFIFLIRDIETRTILFMGRLLDPLKF